jgi:hypothetical protein
VATRDGLPPEIVHGKVHEYWTTLTDHESGVAAAEDAGNPIRRLNAHPKLPRTAVGVSIT